MQHSIKIIKNWKIKNRRAVIQRLSWIRNQEDGVIIHHYDGTEEILVVKKDNLVYLHFVGDYTDEDGNNKEKIVSDAMSLIDVSNPLVLHSPYAHAMMMSLVFVDDPKHLYMLGFGGGRIPMVLHHHLPDLIIESSEQSKGVVSLLEICFGIKANEKAGRINVNTTNGKEHLQSFSFGYFEIILLDTFSGAGIHPNELSSPDFYQLCKDKLCDKGVVATNLVSSSPDYDQKMKDFCNSFKHCYSFDHGNNHVFLGSDCIDMTETEMIKRATLVDRKYQFDFSLAELAAQVVIH